MEFPVHLSRCLTKSSLLVPALGCLRRILLRCTSACWSQGVTTGWLEECIGPASAQGLQLLQQLSAMHPQAGMAHTEIHSECHPASAKVAMCCLPLTTSGVQTLCRMAALLMEAAAHRQHEVQQICCQWRLDSLSRRADLAAGTEAPKQNQLGK